MVESIIRRYGRRFLSLVFVCCLFCEILPANLMAEESQRIIDNDVQEASVIEVNPLYADVLCEEDLAKELDAIAVPQAESDVVYTTEEEVAQAFKEAMKKRETTLVVQYQTTENLFADGALNAFTQRLITLALAHTGNPQEGDFLRWQYGGFETDISGGSSGGVYTDTLTFTLNYYTTLEQETELTTAVNSLLSSLNLEGKTNYEKFRTIYDYMTENIVYDYANLHDDSYKLKYTAYAALINKTAVCQGYALLLYRLLLEEGIDARLIAGNATNSSGESEGHAWNIVKLGRYYYNTDSTWDASYHQGGVDYAFYLRNMENFNKDHVRDEEYLSDDFMAKYPMSPNDYVEGQEEEEIVTVKTPEITSVLSEEDGLHVYFTEDEHAVSYDVEYRAYETFRNGDWYGGTINATASNVLISNSREFYRYDVRVRADYGENLGYSEYSDFVSALYIKEGVERTFTVLEENVPQSITASYQDDYRLFTFTPEQTETYKIYTTGGSAAHIMVLDENWKDLTYDTYDDGTDDVVTYPELTAGKTYYVAIHSDFVDPSSFELKAEVNTDLLVESIEVEDVIVFENDVYFWTDDYYDDANELHTATWGRYHHQPKQMTVTTNKGVFSGDENSVMEEINAVSETHLELYRWDDQSVTNVWSKGMHQANIKIGYCQTYYNVNIVDSPILNVEVRDVEIDEYKFTYWDYVIYDENGDVVRDENGNQVYGHAKYYDVSPYIVVETTKGTFEGLKEDVMGDLYDAYDGYSFQRECKDTQTDTEPWGVGTYTAQFCFNGEMTDYQVTIVDNHMSELLVDLETQSSFEAGAENEVLYRYFSFTPESDGIYKLAERLVPADQYQRSESTYYDYYLYNPENETTTLIESNTKLQLKKDIQYTVILKYCNMDPKIDFIVYMTQQENATIVSAVTDDLYFFHGDMNPATGNRYEIYPDKVTVTMSDGATYSGYTYQLSSWLQENYGMVGRVYTTTETGSENWEIGDHVCELHIDDYVFNYMAHVLENPVAEVSVSDKNYKLSDITEVYDYDHMDESGNPTAYQGFYDYPEYITVTLKDGNTLSGYPNDVADQLKEQYTAWPSFVYYSDQSSVNPWGVGTHTCTYYFAGIQTTYNVIISENTSTDVKVASAYIDDIIKFENDRVPVYLFKLQYDSELQYELSNYNIHVTMSDGKQYEGQIYDVKEQIDQAYGTDINESIYNTQFEKPWTLGDNYERFVFGEIDSTFCVRIIENPITEVIVEDFSIPQGTNQQNHWALINDEGVTFREYRVAPDTLTVKTAEKTYTGSPYDIKEQLLADYGADVSFYYETDQSPTVSWDVGEHDVTMHFGGHEAHYKVTITEEQESLIESITVDDMYFFDGDGYPERMFQLEYDSNKRYDESPRSMTLTMKDGTVFSGTFSEVTNEFNHHYGVYISFNYPDTQPWDIGDHLIEYEIGNPSFGFVSGSYTVHILENPVLSVSAEPISMFEGTHKETRYNEIDGEFVQYEAYTTVPDTIHVTTKDKTYDGSVYSVAAQLEEDYGITVVNYYFQDDQTNTNLWGVGEHPSILHIAGREANYTVTIEKDLIELLEVPSYKIIKGNGSLWTFYDTEEPYQQMVYQIFPYKIRVIANGKEYYGTRNEVEEQVNADLGTNYGYYMTVDNRISAGWDLGEHMLTGYMGSKVADYTITIVEDPGLTITVETIHLKESDAMTVGVAGSDDTWKMYNFLPEKMSVTLNGKTYSGYYAEVLDEILEKENIYLTFNYQQDQSPDNQWGVGEHTVYIGYLNGEATIPYQVIIEPDQVAEYEVKQWQWESDYSEVVLVLVNKNDPTDTVELEATISVEKHMPSCETAGEFIYTATAEYLGVTYTDTKTVIKNPTGHIWGFRGWNWAEDYSYADAHFVCLHDATHTKDIREQAEVTRVEPTCETEGKITYYVYTILDEEEYEDTREVAIEALGHDYQFVGFEWDEHYASAEALFECSHDAAHKMRLEAEISVTSRPATCEEDGATVYTATVEYNNEVYTDQKTAVTERAKGHLWSFKEWVWAEDNLSADAHFYCLHDATHTKVVHEEAEVTRVEPTCETEGSITYYVYTILNEEEYEDSKVVTLDALGHDYQLKSWNWAEDYSSASAEFVCSHDAEHKQSVAAVITSVRVEPTEEAEGSITYTATVEFEGKTYTDEKVEVLEKLTPEVLLAIESLTNTSSGVVIEWNKVNNATKYEVYRKEADWDTFYLIRETVTNVYTDDDVEAGVTYDYRVRAYINGEWSEFSEEKRITFNPFTDVSPALGNTTYKSILWAYENGIVKGVTETEYRPGEYCTRAQLCVMLWRLAGKPSVSTSDNPFSDVSKALGNTTYKAILWAYQKGIVKGVGDGKFDPNGNTSRANMAVMLWRMAGKPAITATSSPFVDVTKELGNTTYKSILWAYEINLTKGTDKTHYSPNDPCTRAQLAVFLYRLNNTYGFID